jgi:hypothetical protein
LRVIGTSLALVIRTSIVWAASIRLVPLWRAVFLLLVVRRHRPSVWLGRLPAIVGIHRRLIFLNRSSRALFDAALVSGHLSGRVGAWYSGRRLISLVGLIRLVGAIVRSLIAIALCGRELAGVLWPATNRDQMRWCCDNCASRKRSGLRSLADWRRLRYGSWLCSDLLPTLINQHRPLYLDRNVSNGTSDDWARRCSNGRLRHGSYLLHFPRIDSNCDVTDAAA